MTQKIVAAACRIAAREQKTLMLGDLTVHRDWGWAPEYVVAMHRLLQVEQPQDLVIATGRSDSLQEFVKIVFTTVGLDWKAYVRHDPAFVRPTELAYGRADPSRAEKAIGWRARSMTGPCGVRKAASSPSIRAAEDGDAVAEAGHANAEPAAGRIPFPGRLLSFHHEPRPPGPVADVLAGDSRSPAVIRRRTTLPPEP